MSRPRTPTAILDTKGAFLAQPGRRRNGEPQPIGSIGSAPKHFSDDQKKIWRELVRGLPAGVGKSADRWAAETIVLLKAKERADTIKGNELARLTSLYGRFGMTPSDRAKISVEVPKESKLQRFLAGRNTGTSADPPPIQ
jgi:phage terminase small subunit